ncbi:hypothetical protein [Streptantibioticus cattleyicolor]|nr:hypothetical protein [Streptantibioticus cattleyicolor]
MAKADHRTCRTRIRAGELGRWIGMSESMVDHTVLPSLKESRAVTRRTTRTDSGRTTGLECVVMPLWQARRRGDVGHPLALSKKELVTLLRLLEALFAPGWGKGATPAGLLAGQRGRGAATDRLALLLLVLQAGSDGRVRLVGGSLPDGRGRAAATVARALGCSISGGSKVLARLKRLEAVVTVPVKTSSGLFGKTRLVVPAVAAANGRSGDGSADESSWDEPFEDDDEFDEMFPASEVSSVNEEETQPSPDRVILCDCCRHGHDGGPDGAQEAHQAEENGELAGDGWAQASFDDLADRAELRSPAAAPGGPGAEGADGTRTAHGIGVVSQHSDSEVPEHPAAVPLHPNHPSPTQVSPHVTVRSRFSGVAGRGSGGRPERADAREGARAAGVKPVGKRSVRRGAGRPLRGERPQIPAARAERSRGADPLAAFAVSAPPRDLREALAPVAAVWARLDRAGARIRVARAARDELARIAGVTGVDPAARMLAERLTRRLCEQGGPQAVADPVGWLLGRGLPRRGACGDVRCDDGVRMDTGATCPACALRVADRRTLRRVVAEEVTAGMAHAPEPERRAETERRLAARTRQDARQAAVRREQDLRRRAAREAEAARRRAEAEAAERARQALACADCGAERSAGRCAACTGRRAVHAVVERAVALVVAASTEPGDSAAGRRTAELTEANLRARIERECAAMAAAGGTPEGLAVQARLTAELAAAEYRRTALALLARAPEAEAEARRAYETALRAPGVRRAQALAEAQRQADAARSRTARHLLEARITAQRAATATDASEPDRYARQADRVRAALRAGRPAASAR